MMKPQSTPHFVEEIQEALAEAGLSDAQLVSATRETAAFGDSVAVFRVGPLLLRFTRERGQAFIDLTSAANPTTFHQFDDVDVAMGWRLTDDVLAKREPEPIHSVLRRVSANLGALGDAFSGDQERLTRARVEKAARERGQAFTARLRGKP
jgi:hypothetical protein